MRIISQDGSTDFLYDGIILSVEGNVITAMYGDTTTIVAAYSSHKKAMEAMDILHQRYSRMDISFWRFPLEDDL